MKTDTRLVVAIVASALFIGWVAGSSPESPLNPNPPQPIKRALAGVIRTAARIGLWVAIAGEKPQPKQERQLVMAPRVDEDGHPLIDHREGW